MLRLRTSLLRLSVGMNERRSDAESRTGPDLFFVSQGNLLDSALCVADR